MFRFVLENETVKYPLFAAYAAFNAMTFCSKLKPFQGLLLFQIKKSRDVYWRRSKVTEDIKVGKCIEMN